MYIFIEYIQILGQIPVVVSPHQEKDISYHINMRVNNQLISEPWPPYSPDFKF